MSGNGDHRQTLLPGAGIGHGKKLHQLRKDPLRIEVAVVDPEPGVAIVDLYECVGLLPLGTMENARLLIPGIQFDVLSHLHPKSGPGAAMPGRDRIPGQPGVIPFQVAC